ncbi:MAG TPA: hypothetical protein VGD78_23230 [Chthoniobacterales bacterium]
MKKPALARTLTGIGVFVVVAVVVFALLPKLLHNSTPDTPAWQAQMSPIATLKTPDYAEPKRPVTAQPAPSATPSPVAPPSTPVAQVSPQPEAQTAPSAPLLAPVTPDAAPASTMKTSPAPTAQAAPVGASNDETAQVKKQVLERIDLMPKLSSGDRAKLYEAVDRARGMFKLAVVPFETGRAAPVATTIGQLGERLRSPEAQRLLTDPTVIVVVLGYADSKGNEKLNLQVSGERAENLVKVLRDQIKVMNVMHAVGMGTSQLFSREQLEKNRVAEVWAVLP